MKSCARAYWSSSRPSRKAPSRRLCTGPARPRTGRQAGQAGQSARRRARTPFRPLPPPQLALAPCRSRALPAHLCSAPRSQRHVPPLPLPPLPDRLRPLRSRPSCASSPRRMPMHQEACGTGIPMHLRWPPRPLRTTSRPRHLCHPISPQACAARRPSRQSHSQHMHKRHPSTPTGAAAASAMKRAARSAYARSSA